MAINGRSLKKVSSIFPLMAINGKFKYNHGGTHLCLNFRCIPEEEESTGDTHITR
jgi:hypothetical protein